MNVIKTEFSQIGEGQKCFVIAEIGSNHNGEYDLACEMIARAAEAGVDAVKFQTFQAKHHYSKKTPKIALYDKDIYQLIEELEIDRTWHAKLSLECKRHRIDFLDSPCDAEAIAIAQSVNMPIMKVASFDMVDQGLIRTIARTGKGVMFSTGMANVAEIHQAVTTCRAEGNDQIIVLQCTSLYPAPPELSNLHAMRTMGQMFNVLTGYSDHTMGDHIPLAAVALGARVIEKHYTLDRRMKGPDHAFGIEPRELAEMMKKLREIEAALGDGQKNGPRAQEMELFNKARRSVIARVDLNPGDTIQESDLVIKRPGLGVHPSHLPLLVGRKVRVKIEAEEPVTWDKV